MHERRPEEELTENARRSAHIQVMMLMCGPWQANGRPPCSSPEAIAQDRREVMVPVGNGALWGVLEYLWATAPPESTPEQLRHHLWATFEFIAPHITEAPAGKFWADVAILERGQADGGVS